MKVQEKYEMLKRYLAELGSVAVAFSSGVDSTFLLRTAHDVLGDRAIAVTAQSCLFPGREQREAGQYCQKNGIRQVVFRPEVLAIEGFCENPRNRCYLCKRELFRGILRIAKEQGMAAVAEGSNVDDEGDYRPGMAAVKELGVKSPLLEAGLTKAEIRELSRELGLPTWDKPSYACLASRFVYGETISEERLAMVERAEELLRELGFRQMRVRLHGNMARIEVLPEEIERMARPEIRETVASRLKEYGFSYVALDLSGYRMGSMNAT